MYEAVIFDFDYTLGDSTGGIVLSINYALRQLGYSEKSVEEIRKTIGLSLRDTFICLTGTHTKNEANFFAELFRQKSDEVMVEHTELYLPAGEVLKKLKEQNYKTGIVTTKYHYRIDQILNKFNIRSLIDIVTGAEDVTAEKPDPEGLNLTAAKLQTATQNVLYVGDSIVDAQTAARAQVDFAAVLTGTSKQNAFESYAPVCIAVSLYDIYDFIRRRTNRPVSGNSF